MPSWRRWNKKSWTTGWQVPSGLQSMLQSHRRAFTMDRRVSLFFQNISGLN